ncbi:hypothetical protein L218DRAFT_1003150 [Marasmius fiardii PR-910]|nr:hypothetical protein L218DRAFT_1003150 [Marasmius fiardii PR-910]
MPSRRRGTRAKPSTCSRVPFASLHFEHDLKYLKAQAENAGKYFRMEPKDFLDEFFPTNPDEPTFELKEEAECALEDAASRDIEEDSYPDFIKAFQIYSPSFKFCDTHSRPAEVSYVEIKPDITSYSETSVEEDGDPVNLEEAEIIVEVKISLADDPFEDDEENLEDTTEDGAGTRGQVTMYATQQLARRHRTHCFSVVIVGTCARLLRWDRAGAIVTSLFDYTEMPWLTMFFHKYNYADREVRGIDTSVSRLDEYWGDANIRRWDVEARQHLELDPHDLLYIFEVYDNDELSVFIGSEPCIERTDYLTGRGTRCYRVYDPERKRILFLKDAWRGKGTLLIGTYATGGPLTIQVAGRGHGNSYQQGCCLVALRFKSISECTIYHVLIWMILKFGPHHTTGKDLHIALVRMFDEVHFQASITTSDEDNEKEQCRDDDQDNDNDHNKKKETGGLVKRSFLITRIVSQEVRIQNISLQEFIMTLENTFRTRYLTRARQPEQHANYSRASYLSDWDEQDEHFQQYEQQLTKQRHARLSTHTWFVDIFSRMATKKEKMPEKLKPRFPRRRSKNPARNRRRKRERSDRSWNRWADIFRSRKKQKT